VLLGGLCSCNRKGRGKDHRIIELSLNNWLLPLMIYYDAETHDCKFSVSDLYMVG
jgi:hypothetical protein